MPGAPASIMADALAQLVDLDTNLRHIAA
jgi:hypothetical protein